MTDKQKFYTLATFFIFLLLVVFIPTGEDGTWTFIDSFTAFVTAPFVGYLTWKYSKKI